MFCVMVLIFVTVFRRRVLVVVAAVSVGFMEVEAIILFKGFEMVSASKLVLGWVAWM